jgi:hypothetical protein
MWYDFGLIGDEGAVSSHNLIWGVVKMLQAIVWSSDADLTRIEAL